MTEQLFLKQFNQLPENMKEELLAFLEKLLAKNKNEIVNHSEQGKPDGGVPPGSSKPLPIVKIERSGKPVALKFGSGKHLVEFLTDDFNAPLDDFKEYM